MNRNSLYSSILIVLATVGLATSSLADHSWGPYHWARTTQSFDLTIINSTTSDWDVFVSDAVSDWSASGKLNMIEDTGGDTSKKTRRRCQGGTGTVRYVSATWPMAIPVGWELRAFRSIPMTTSSPATPS